jgi:hypothetical protein
MRDGVSIPVHLSGAEPTYSGETLPTWIINACGPTSVLDASAVLCADGSDSKSLRLAVVNRSMDTTYEHVPIRIAFRNVAQTPVQVREIWHENAFAKNGWGTEGEPTEDNVTVKTWTEEWTGAYTFKPHSFTLFIIGVE